MAIPNPKANQLGNVVMEKNSNNQKKDETPRIPLGIILREQGATTKDGPLTKEQVAKALDTQKKERDSSPDGKGRLLGQILVSDFGLKQEAVDKAFKTQTERLDVQKRIEAKLLESGAATKEQLKEVHDKQLKNIKADESPKDFKKLLEDSGVQPSEVTQAEAAAQKDIAIEQQQKAIEEGLGKAPAATERIEKVEPIRK